MTVYIQRDRIQGHTVATTWTGDILGEVTASGGDWRDNFGGTRENITVVLRGGTVYHGTYYKSSGDYARLKKAKRQPNTQE
jgi:hypothetical protein